MHRLSSKKGEDHNYHHHQYASGPGWKLLDSTGHTEIARWIDYDPMGGTARIELAQTPWHNRTVVMPAAMQEQSLLWLRRR